MKKQLTFIFLCFMLVNNILAAICIPHTVLQPPINSCIGVEVQVIPKCSIMIQKITDPKLPKGLNVDIDYNENKNYSDKVYVSLLSSSKFIFQLTTDYKGPGNFYITPCFFECGNIYLDLKKEISFNAERPYSVELKHGLYDYRLEYRFSYKDKKFYDIKAGIYTGNVYITMYLP